MVFIKQYLIFRSKLPLPSASWEVTMDVGSLVGLPRVRAILRAVAAGRVHITCSCEPDMYIDGLPYCDQFTAHALARCGLIQPARPGVLGQRVPARLTVKGHELLGEEGAAA